MNFMVARFSNSKFVRRTQANLGTWRFERQAVFLSRTRPEFVWRQTAKLASSSPVPGKSKAQNKPEFIYDCSLYDKSTLHCRIPSISAVLCEFSAPRTAFRADAIANSVEGCRIFNWLCRKYPMLPDCRLLQWKLVRYDKW